MIASSYRVLELETGSVLYTELTMVQLQTLVREHDTLSFIEIPHMDGTEHLLRIRSITRIFESNPESRQMIDELNFARNIEVADYRAEKIKEHMNEIEQQSEEANQPNPFGSLKLDRTPPQA